MEGVTIGRLEWTIKYSKAPESVEEVANFIDACIYYLTAQVAGGDQATFLFMREPTGNIFSTAFNGAFHTIMGHLHSDRSGFSKLARYSFFVTKEGSIGFAPGILKSEDVIVVFCGLPGAVRVTFSRWYSQFSVAWAMLRSWHDGRKE